MAETYPAAPPDKNYRPKPQLPPRTVVGYVERGPEHSRPSTKAEAEAEHDRLCGPVLARARAKL